MSTVRLAAREADRDDGGYYLIVTMNSGRVYRGALRRHRPEDGAHAVGAFILELPAPAPPLAVTRTLYLNEAQVESVEIDW